MARKSCLIFLLRSRSHTFLSVAFILSGEMAVAYFMYHAAQGFWPLLNGGEGVVLYCFIFLYLASTDGGPWSLERLLRKRASTV